MRGGGMLSSVGLGGALELLRRDLHPAGRPRQRREAVEPMQVYEASPLAAEVPDEDRQLGQPRRSINERVPEQQLPVDRKVLTAFGEQLVDPRTRAQDELLGVMYAAVGADARPLRRSVPLQNRLSEAKTPTRLRRQSELRR